MNIFDYSLSFSNSEPFLLAELRRETNIKALMPRMLSGHYQGVLLSFISKMIKPKNILELGTFTGYSTLCLSAGLCSDGKIITIDKNDELEYISQKYFKKSVFNKNITQIFGDAKLVIPKLNYLFDLVFIDADKREYLDYYNKVFDKINKGGFILADNVFWNGKVFDTSNNNDPYTQGIVEFNEFVKNDNRVNLITLPIRDGLMIIEKK